VGREGEEAYAGGDMNRKNLKTGGWGKGRLRGTGKGARNSFDKEEKGRSNAIKKRQGIQAEKRAGVEKMRMQKDLSSRTA